MKLSIVVLTHNRMAALRECLIRIEANTIEADAEVLVVNNGSTDRTREWVDIAAANKNPIPITVIHRETNEGVCARNYAILQAKGEYIAQVDDDVMVMAGWDRILLEPMERDPQIGATGQEGLYQEQSWTRQPWSAGLIDDRRKPQVGQFCDFVTGYCWAWRALHRIRSLDLVSGHGHVYGNADGTKARCGGPAICPACKMEQDNLDPVFLYDERFNPFWHEESDLQLQIRAMRSRILRVRECAIHRSLHPWDATMADEGPTAKSQAETNFALLKSKWMADPRVKYEGALVGLRA